MLSYLGDFLVVTNKYTNAGKSETTVHQMWAHFSF